MKNWKEAIRYCLVGGLATLVDWAALVVCTEWVFAPLKAAAVYPAHVVSFLLGLTVNYLLSNAFVFTAAHQRGKGNSVKAFLLFALIGLIGLGFTELGAWVGAVTLGNETVLLSLFGQPVKAYLAVKIVMTLLVLIWNYLARKLLIYDRKEKSA